MSGRGWSYVKGAPFGAFDFWVEREFESIEKGIEDGAYGLRWDDLRFAAGSIVINPVGSVDAPTPDNTEAGFPASLLFSGSADNIIADCAQLPHSWKLGSIIRPHVHWMKTSASANAVTWEFFYRIIGNVGSATGAWSSAVTRSSTDATTVGDQSLADVHLLTSFGDIDMTGLTESCLVAWRLYRRGSSDAYAGTARMLSFDIHYQSDGRGSVSEYPI